MIDERYDRSADMRLLELQREALGVPRRIIASTSYTDPDPLADMSSDQEDAYVEGGAIVIAAIDAQPRSLLIAGALVTVSLSVTNDGDLPARGVRVTLPLPADTVYRAGTFVIDGVTASDATVNDLFGNGAELDDIAPRMRRSLLLKLVIEAGVKDIILSPHLRAASGAVLGLRAMRLTRGIAGRPAVPERPFYESDDAEHHTEPLAPPPIARTITVLQPREVPPVIPATAPARTPAAAGQQPPTPPAIKPAATEAPEPVALQAVEPTALQAVEPVAPQALTPVAPPAVNAVPAQPVIRSVPEPKSKPRPRVKAKPKSKAESPPASMPQEASKAGGAEVSEPARLEIPSKVEVVRSTEARVYVAGRGGPVLTVRIDRKRLATLTGLFSAASLGMIAHYLLLNALAAKDALPDTGGDTSIAVFVANQEQLLSRALIATRLGKAPAPDSLSATLPAWPPALEIISDQREIETARPGTAVLVRAFQPTDMAFLQRTLSNDKTAPFLRAAQLFVGLCANDVLVADERDRRHVGVALTAYAALATAEISRIFLRAKLHRAPVIFKATDAGLDDAARTVLTALGRSIA